jgi:hypothetical protein
MFRIPDTWTVGQWRDFEKANPHLPQCAHRATCTTYSDFLTILYIEIDTIVNALVQDRNTLQNHSENALNADICRQLNRTGYSAHHDKNNGGHTDISVEYTRFTWIGEGKKVASVNNSHLTDGYNQLRDRYVPGTNGADQAGLLIYCYAPDAKHVVTKWSEHLKTSDDANPGYASDIAQCPENPGFSLWSSSKHPGSGSTIKIKHIALPLFWSQPK